MKTATMRRPTLFGLTGPVLVLVLTGCAAEQIAGPAKLTSTTLHETVVTYTGEDALGRIRAIEMATPLNAEARRTVGPVRRLGDVEWDDAAQAGITSKGTTASWATGRVTAE